MRIALAQALPADTSTEQVVKDVTDARGDLESVRLSGEMIDEGETLNLDVLISESGECEGSVGMEGGGSFELLQVDGSSCFKPDEEFWKAQAGEGAEQLISMAGDRWVTNSEDPHRILRFDVDEEGQVDFTDFNEELSVEKPSADETFDLASLG